MNSMPEYFPILTRTFSTWCEGCGELGKTSNIDRSHGSCIGCMESRVVEFLFLEHTESSNRHLRLIMDMRRIFDSGYDKIVNSANIALQIQEEVKKSKCNNIIP